MPEALLVATPVSTTRTDPNTLVVEFQGNAKALTEEGTLSTLRVSVNAFGGTVQVSMDYLIENGVPSHRATRSDMADAVPTEDGQSTVVESIGGRVEGTWTADNSLTLTVDGFEIPEDSVEVQVLLQETSTSELHVLR